MTTVPITIRMEVIVTIQVCLISQITFDYKKNGGKKKNFLEIQSINIVYHNMENMIIVPITIRNGDYYEYQSLPHFTNEH